MNLGNLAMAALSGAVLIVLGLIPGLFQTLVERLQDNLHRFSGSVFQPLPLRRLRSAQPPELIRPWGLAIVGFAIIAVSLWNYLRIPQ